MDTRTLRDLLLAGNERYQSGDLHGALALYREALELHPDTRAARANIAVVLHDLGDTPGAIAECRKLLEVAPEDERVRFFAGHLLRESGRFEEAVAEYEAILRRNPANDRAAVRLNETLRMLQRPARDSAKAACIYSAIFGDYDPIHEPERQNLDCDYILFTDRSDFNPPPALWKVVTIDTHRLYRMHPRMRAKFFRIMVHEVFPLLSRMDHDAGLHQYDHAIWVDGSVRITSPDFAAFMIGSIGRHGLAMLKHPDRRCIYEEAAHSVGLLKYRYQRIREQVDHYRRQGYPENNGLMAATVSARDMRRRDLDHVFADWWEENLKWTYQDQLSLPYVLWKHGRWYDEIDQELVRNPYFVWEYTRRKKTSQET